ncbi:hypothetical protein JCGZ_15158 [Jatropha curcas]|uniref:Uncharacterized protein n=1 Tax=Jatropha curcas TaxID=180498 RepID=A0A067LDK5_JATCU|nr:SKI/DACH domain-containing protein 1 [Jatropha curcas]KDP45293.1 hypothetical protein JCGZ_15158 [Jatropha curcas]
MESPFRIRRRPPCLPHHHHHHHHRHHHLCHGHPHQLCSLHNHYHHHYCNCHFLICPGLAPVPLQVADPYAPYPSENEFNLQSNANTENYNSITQVLQEPEINDLEDEQEENDDPVFVLTDEWREFFAKSEAKRKLEKQQAKKKDKDKRSRGKARNALDLEQSNAQTSDN